jgi:pimeloyl-ACP methyl ester carboxylesterase
LLFHPTPGAGPFDPNPTITARSGVHLLAIDRPGYGASPAPSEPRTVQHEADDVAEFVRQSDDIARSSGARAFGTVGVVGWGTGGMIALSLAARHPDLVDRVAVVNTPTPRAGKSAIGAKMLPPFTRSSLFITDDPALATRRGLGNRVDRMLVEAALQGSAGVDADRTMLTDRSWAQQLERITAEVRLIYGDDDRATSIIDGHWYRRHISGSRSVRVPGQGPLTIAACWSRILDHVAPQD